MLRILVQTSEAYQLRDGHTVDNPTPDSELTRPQKVTAVIFAGLPMVVAQTMEALHIDVTEDKITVKQVDPDFVEINGNDIVITIRPIYTPGRYALQEGMIKLFALGLADVLTARFPEIDLPDVIIDIDFQYGCGCKIDSKGQIVAKW